MTTNQLKYWAQVEDARHNRAVEDETNRSNLAKEAENIAVRQSNERLKKYDVDQRTQTSEFATRTSAMTAAKERDLKRALKTQEGKQKLMELIAKDPINVSSLDALVDDQGRTLYDPDFDITTVSDWNKIPLTLRDVLVDFIKQFSF